MGNGSPTPAPTPAPTPSGPWASWAGIAPFCPAEHTVSQHCSGLTTGLYDKTGDGQPCWTGTKGCCCHNYHQPNGIQTFADLDKCTAQCQEDIDNQSITSTYHLSMQQSILLLFVLISFIICQICFCVRFIGRHCAKKAAKKEEKESDNVQYETDDSEAHELLDSSK